MNRTGQLFLQALLRICSELLLDLLVVVSHVAWVVLPLSVLLGFSLDWL
jgi:hypothetical protein